MAGSQRLRGSQRAESHENGGADLRGCDVSAHRHHPDRRRRPVRRAGRQAAPVPPVRWTLPGRSVAECGTCPRLSLLSTERYAASYAMA
jgi:hypothetical protein